MRVKLACPKLHYSRIFRGDLANIWFTAINDVPKLKIQIAIIISDLKSK